MKKITPLFLMLFYSIILNSQNNFVKGYFIDNNNTKTNCLIKNIDWKNNPDHIKFKIKLDTETKSISSNELKEFGINDIKFVVREVLVDKSFFNTNNLTHLKELSFVKEKLTLKVLVEGDVTLYSYKKGPTNIFFFKTSSNKIKQLEYKEYLFNNKIAENNNFKKQLWDELNSSTNFTVDQVNSVDYNKKDLVEFFKEYHKRKHINYTEFSKTQKTKFNLKLAAGIKTSGLSIERSDGSNPSQNDEKNADFNNEFGFVVGLEAEIIMPYNNNKWSLVFNPRYHSFASKTTNEYGWIESEFSAFDMPIGPRYYLYLNEDSKIYFDLFYVVNLYSKTTIDYENFLSLTKGKSTNNFSAGIGYSFGKFYSELRYDFPRNILNGEKFWDSKFSSFGLNFAFTII